MTTDPVAVRDVFASHYFLFAFLASLGTLQISATISGARGLWLTPHRMATRWLGIVFIITGILVFFGQPLWIDGPWAAGSVEADSATRGWGQANWDELAGARNVNDIHGGLDGSTQATWFPLAAILAFATSAVLGFVNLRVSKSGDSTSAGPQAMSDQPGGLAGLAERSFFANLPISWRTFRSEIAGVWTGGLDSADRWSVFRSIFGRSRTKS